MFLRFLLNFLLILLSGVVTFAQSEVNSIKVNGTVLDASTKEEISAKIKYESLPYGSKIGIFSGKTFEFNMEDGNEYMIMVEAEGYTPHTEKLLANDAVDGVIEKTIELQSTGVNQLMRLDKLIFALGKAQITEASHEELDKLGTMLNANSSMEIQLEGHTDFRGNARQNMKLSEERVEAVRDYLVKKGIDKHRIKTKAFGGTKPLSRGNDDESRRQNRRVEVRILSN